MRILIPFGRTNPGRHGFVGVRRAARLWVAMAAAAGVLVLGITAPDPARAQTPAPDVTPRHAQAADPAHPKAAPRQAPSGTAAAAAAAREVVEAQLQAFLADDAARAFSFAAPGIQMRFGNAERFVAMVRGAYPAVYRPARYRFLQAEPSGDALVQPVSIEDADGRGWVAVYVLTRQPDASWRIEGCQLTPDPGSRT